MYKNICLFLIAAGVLAGCKNNNIEMTYFLSEILRLDSPSKTSALVLSIFFLIFQIETYPKNRL